MDRERRLVRNSKVHDQAAQLPSPASSPARDSAVMVDVVVLSGDLSLFEAIRHAVGERNPVWRARSAEESVELLLTGRCGVLLIDMAAVSTQPATLIEQIGEQFPDLVVVVAGRRDDETLLARLISDGLVYRFMHKPLSPKRAGMFLNAAIRSHVERRESRSLAPLLPLMGGLRTRIELRKWLFVTVGLALLLVLLAALLLDDRRAARPASAPGPPRRAGRRRRRRRGRLRIPCCRARVRPWRPGVTRPLPDATRSICTRPCCSPDRHTRRRAPDSTRPRHAWWQWPASEAQAGRRGRSAPTGRARAGGRSRPRLRASAAGATGHAAGSGDRTSRLARRDSCRSRCRDDCGAACNSCRTACDAAGACIAARCDRRDAGGQAAHRPRHAGPGDARSADATLRGAGRGAIVPPDLEPWIESHVRPADHLGPPDRGIRQAAAGSRAHRATGARDADRRAGALPDRDLEQLTATEPVYPPEALRDRVEGWVEVDFTVTEAGVVREIEVVAAEPRGVFEAAATAAIGEWRFQPRVVNGRPVPQRSSVTLRFNVEG